MRLNNEIQVLMLNNKEIIKFLIIAYIKKTIKSNFIASKYRSITKL